MGWKRKQNLMQEKAAVERELEGRLSFLSGKGIPSPKADKDPLVRKLKADIRAVNRRLKAIADNEKRAEEVAKAKADREAAPKKEQEGGKGGKPRKGPEEGKGKKAKVEGKTAPPKASASGKSGKAAESSEEGKAVAPRKPEETKGEPAAK